MISDRELDEINNRAESGDYHEMACSYRHDVRVLIQELRKSRALNKEFREALGFYAHCSERVGKEFQIDGTKPFGEKARAALEKEKEIMGE